MRTKGIYIAVVKNLEDKLSTLSCSSSSEGVKVRSSGEVNNVNNDSRASSFLPPLDTTRSQSASSAGRSAKGSSPNVDERHLNLTLFGLPESRSIIDLKKAVDEIFEFLADRPIQLKDMFRLGKWKSTCSSHPRPVLVKLCAAWDRKILLVQKRKLQQFRVKRLFLRADVPPEHRLRRGSTTKPNAKPESVPSCSDATQPHNVQTDTSVGFSSSVSTADSPCNISYGLNSRRSSSPGSESTSSSSTIVLGHSSS